MPWLLRPQPPRISSTVATTPPGISLGASLGRSNFLLPRDWLALGMRKPAEPPVSVGVGLRWRPGEACRGGFSSSMTL